MRRSVLDPAALKAAKTFAQKPWQPSSRMRVGNLDGTGVLSLWIGAHPRETCEPSDKPALLATNLEG
jgi:hypothetical protein